MDNAQARLAMLEHRRRKMTNGYGLIDVRCACGRDWPCPTRQEADMALDNPPWWARIADAMRRHYRVTTLFAVTAVSAGSALILAGLSNLLLIDDAQMLALTLTVLVALFTMISVLRRTDR